MSHTANITLCVLWEDELRLAAKLLRAAADAPDDDHDLLAQQAYAACQVALWGLTDERHAVILAASDLRTKPAEPKDDDSSGITVLDKGKQ